MCSRVEAMEAAIHAAPGELTLREVLSDALLELGDPRGEFIALQLDGSTRARKRSLKLLARHRLAFLGPLAGLLERGSDEWRHGFPVAGAMVLLGRTGPLPCLSTLERLTVELTDAEPVELTSPDLRSLREVFVRLPTADPWEWREQAEQRRWLAVQRAQQALATVKRQHLLRLGRWWQ